MFTKHMMWGRCHIVLWHYCPSLPLVTLPSITSSCDITLHHFLQGRMQRMWDIDGCHKPWSDLAVHLFNSLTTWHMAFQTQSRQTRHWAALTAFVIDLFPSQTCCRASLLWLALLCDEVLYPASLLEHRRLSYAIVHCVKLQLCLEG